MLHEYATQEEADANNASLYCAAVLRDYIGYEWFYGDTAAEALTLAAKFMTKTQGANSAYLQRYVQGIGWYDLYPRDHASIVKKEGRYDIDPPEELSVVATPEWLRKIAQDLEDNGENFNRTLETQDGKFINIRIPTEEESWA